MISHCKEVIPRYMAKKAEQFVEPKLLRSLRKNGSFVQAAKEHMVWAERVSDNKSSLSIIYNPKRGEIYRKGISTELRYFFQGIDEYTVAKSEFIKQRARTQKSFPDIVAMIAERE